MQFHTCGKLAVHVCVLLVCYMTSAYTTCQKFFSLLFPFIQIFRKKKKKKAHEGCPAGRVTSNATCWRTVKDGALCLGREVSKNTFV